MNISGILVNISGITSGSRGISVVYQSKSAEKFGDITSGMPK